MYSNKTVINKTIESITDYLNGLDNDELVSIHNTYCREQNYSDDEIFNNDEDFFNTYFEGKVLEAVRAVSFGEYNYRDEYVIFNGYGNLETFNNPADHVDISAIANNILESPENYDIELNEVFESEGILYEGTEEDAREEYEGYKTDLEDENESLEEDEEKTEILTFSAWVKENIAQAD
jgi:hypothetical protein